MIQILNCDCVCVFQLAHVQEDLRQCQRDRDEALQTVKDLEHKVFELEVETESKAHSNDKTRQVKVLEDRLSAVQMELEEERQSGELLMDRIDRGREQVRSFRRTRILLLCNDKW